MQEERESMLEDQPKKYKKRKAHRKQEIGNKKMFVADVGMQKPNNKSLAIRRNRTKTLVMLKLEQLLL